MANTKPPMAKHLSGMELSNALMLEAFDECIHEWESTNGPYEDVKCIHCDYVPGPHAIASKMIPYHRKFRLLWRIFKGIRSRDDSVGVLLNHLCADNSPNFRATIYCSEPENNRGDIYAFGEDECEAVGRVILKYVRCDIDWTEDQLKGAR